MWTEESRVRVAKIAKKTKRYPCDLTDEEWERIAPLMPKPGRRGRPREVDFREVLKQCVTLFAQVVVGGCSPFIFGSWTLLRTCDEAM